MENKSKLLGIIPLLISGHLAFFDKETIINSAINIDPNGVIHKTYEIAQSDIEKYMPYKQNGSLDERNYDKQTHDKDYTKDYIRKEYEKQYKQYDKSDSNPSVFISESDNSQREAFIAEVIRKYDEIA